ncbi:MAG TPA: NAD(P)-dependent oxidoreductase [Chthonomonadales bacterium]|nr:NAD(P)-dependent oxidoreductase [Chthonomonadales bacterium]
MASVRRRAVAVIGLGAMGGPMAANLARKGFRAVGYDPRSEAMERAVAADVEVAPSAADAFAMTDTALLSLPTQETMEEVVLGAGGLLPHVAGRCIVDATTTTMEAAQRVARAVEAAGGAFLDAPVSGGSAGARDGTLCVMVGGDPEQFRAQRDVLEAIGATVVHVGPCGHGQVAKMVNQMLMAAIYVSVAEGFAFAAKLGADVRSVYAAIEKGGCRSMLLDAIKPNLLSGALSTGGNLAMHGKDIDYVMAEVTRRKLHMPLIAEVHAFYSLARSLGFGDVWSGEMWAVWERLLGIDLTATIRPDPPA